MKEEKPTIEEKKLEAEDTAKIGRITVGDNWEVQLPKKAMDLLKVKPGDKLDIKLEGLNDDVLVIMKA